MASRHLRRSPNWNDHRADWRYVKNGRLWIPANSHSALPPASGATADSPALDRDRHNFFSLTALAQKDLKRVLAYSSINHLGYCLLGRSRWSGCSSGKWDGRGESGRHDGVLLQMFNHAITAATLFYFVALIEKRSGGATRLDQFGGLRTRAPILAGLMGIALFASIGLPGLNGFVGEFLIFKGAFSLIQWAAVIVRRRLAPYGYFPAHTHSAGVSRSSI